MRTFYPVKRELKVKNINRMKQSSSLTISLADHLRVTEMVSYIHSNCCGSRELLSIAALSKKFAISPTRLKSLFRKQYGMSIHQFVLLQRMQQAAEALLLSNAISVSIQCGYNDYCNFCRDFKKIMGKSPNRYRAERCCLVEGSQRIHFSGYAVEY
jgi:AraC-like DNA-binding protein